MIKRLILMGILVAYSALLIEVMVFKDVPMIRIGSLMLNFGGSQTGPANLIPFKTILVYLFSDKGWIIAGLNLLGNIVLLVPFGILVSSVLKNTSWKKMVTIAFATGFAIEITQVVLQIGIFDIDDVLLNALGVMIGYWAFLVSARKLSSMNPKNIRNTAVLAMIIFAGSALYIASRYEKGQLPVSFEPGVWKGQPAPMDHSENPTTRGIDPCNGTGGTGKIIGTGNHTITILKGNGAKQIIKLTNKTIIRNSAGAVLASELKIGDGVTVVVDDSETAAAVLVCDSPSEKP